MIAVEVIMPVWVEWTLKSAATLLAIGVIWRKLLLPVANLVTLMNKAIPLLRKVTDLYDKQPNVISFLEDITKQFTTDSGSTLRDAIDRLEDSAKKNAIAAGVLKENAEISRQLALQDRQHMAELTEAVNILRARTGETTKTVNRMEAGNKVVADDLDKAQTRAEQVQGEPGAAADAAVRRQP